MQKHKIEDNANADGTAKDLIVGVQPGTTYRAVVFNDNMGNLWEVLKSAGYDLISDDLSQLSKALKQPYNPLFTYNTSTISTQTVNDIVLGSDGRYYKVTSNGIIGEDPVGSITGNWQQVSFDSGSMGGGGSIPTTSNFDGILVGDITKNGTNIDISDLYIVGAKGKDTTGYVHATELIPLSSSIVIPNLSANGSSWAYRENSAWNSTDLEPQRTGFSASLLNHSYYDIKSGFWNDRTIGVANSGVDIVDITADAQTKALYRFKANNNDEAQNYSVSGGGSLTYDTTIQGGGIVFNDSADLVDFPTSFTTLLVNNSNSIWLSFSINCNDSSGIYLSNASGTGIGASAFRIDIDGGHLRVAKNEANYLVSTVPVTNSLGNNISVLVELTSKGKRIYINGVLDALDTDASIIVSNSLNAPIVGSTFIRLGQKTSGGSALSMTTGQLRIGTGELSEQQRLAVINEHTVVNTPITDGRSYIAKIDSIGGNIQSVEQLDFVNLLTHKGVTAQSSAVLEENGYTILDNGLIFQWGNKDILYDAFLHGVIFPIAFPNGILNASVTLQLSGSIAGAIGTHCTNLTNTGMDIFGDYDSTSSSGTAYYFAIGY